ncbi:MAG: SMP-30/gluconolactonase/LRE family protein [Acidimicrobiia bacterium]|nr:SMP-30/gluconolactonase/LRE family protein [Acidimicrobiia bacterium]
MADLELLASGYGLLEGPRVDAGGNLFFSDVPNGGIYRLAPDGTVTTAVPKRRGVGGIALHADGGLVVGGRNICHVKDGVTRVLYDPQTGFNDLFVDAAGRVLCGTLRSDPFAEGKRVPGECWRIDAEGSATELYGDIGLTNGIGLSPDDSVIYHSDTAVNGVWAHDYLPDGTVANRRFLVRSDDLLPDGLAVDEAGTVWVADVSGSGAVRGFSPDGTEVGRVSVPAKMVTSVCFGGADRRDMYIVTADNIEDRAKAGSVFRTRAEVAGCAVHLATV